MSQAGYTPIQLYYSTTAAAAPSAGNLANGELAVNITDGKLFYKDNGGVVRVLATAAGSAGDVVGPGSSTDNALVRFDGTTGKLVQSSVGILSDAGALSGLASVAATTFTGALTGNASTATTLQTSRTIWGQSFDGSANVTGALTGVTDLTASGSLTLNGGTANGVAYLNGSKVLTTGSALTFDGTNIATTGGLSLGSANNLTWGGVYGANIPTIAGASNTLQFYPAGSTSGEQMRLTSTGLGIGTSSLSGKLHVAGQTRIQDSANAANYILIGSGANAPRGGNSVMAQTGSMVMGTEGAAPLIFITNAAEGMRLDNIGNLGLGVTPSAWSAFKAFEISNAGNAIWSAGSNDVRITTNHIYNGGDKYVTTGRAAEYIQTVGQHQWYTAPSGTAGNAISFTQAMTLDASGNLLVGQTNKQININSICEMTGSVGIGVRSIGGPASFAGFFWNAATTGDNTLLQFATETGGTIRGSVTYNRSLGLTSYNTTSDRRAKDILGPVTNSGETIDAIQVHIGQMHGATQSRPMFIADELQGPAPYCVTGEKNAVNEKGEPVYQQVDHSPLIPLLVAEIKSLRKRLATAGIA